MSSTAATVTASTAGHVNTYAQVEGGRTNIAERWAVYGHVGDGSASDTRGREEALAAHERVEIERSRRENAGCVSAYWCRVLATPAS